MEEEKLQNKKSVASPPFSDTQVSPKTTARDLVRKTLRERKKRIGRKRTDSINFSSLDGSSPDEEPQQTLLKLKKTLPNNNQFTPTNNSNSFIDSSFSGGYKMQMEPAKEEDKDGESKPEEDNKQSDSQLSTSKRKNLNKRKRVMSTSVTNSFGDFSPPSQAKAKRRRHIVSDAQETDQDQKVDGKSHTQDNEENQSSIKEESNETSSQSKEEEKEPPQNLLKGGGYKMSVMPVLSLDKVNDQVQEEDEDDYFGCSKNKISQNKGKGGRRTRMQSDNNSTLKVAVPDITKLISPKMEYRMYSITEEDKSSSSTSSVKSSDDLTFLSISSKSIISRKKSTFAKRSKKKWSVASFTEALQSQEADFSLKRTSFKIKKYSEGESSPFLNMPKPKVPKKKLKRVKSMMLSKLLLDIELS